jgi:crotonobetainyl-CoA:carnitine CoA-transferase CaiB-like acyl-CoA transferase
MMLEAALAGVHVVEVAAYLPGPVCTGVLAALGARVTKVSRPGGDPLRGLPYLASAYPLVNAAKAEVELDLRSADGATRLRALASEADVLVDGLRPGALARLQLGADELRGLNPRLIYCGLSGFGADSGERAERGGHDLNFLALSGLLAATTAAGEPAIPGTQLADLVGGLTAATAILAALQARAATGAGCTIDAPLLGAARWLMAPWHGVERAGDGAGAEPTAALSGGQACYRLYRTADARHIAVAALESHFWARFCAAIGRPELGPRQHELDQPALIAAVQAVIAGRSLAEWAALFEAVDACVTPVLSVAEAASSWTPAVGLPVATR